MKLVWSDPAVSDLEAIRDYIAHDSDRYAAQFVARIVEAAERLETFPELGRRVPEALDAVNVREVLFQSYRIIYRAESKRVLILAIVHGSRNLSGMRVKPWELG